MSTPNFYNKNASKYYACEINDEIDYDNLELNLQSAFKRGEDTEKWENGLRSYEGQIIKEITEQKDNWIITFQIIIRNGYYSGVNLDWEVLIEYNGRDVNKCGDYDFGDEKIPRYINEFIDKKIDKIEKVFEENSTPLIKVAQFSNGEAMYEKAI